MESKLIFPFIPEPQLKELDWVLQKLLETELAETVILYGSFARGNYRLKDRILPYYKPNEIVPEKSTKIRSDFDLLVLVEKFESIQELELLTAGFGLLMDTPLDLKILDFKTFNTLHLKRNDFIADVLKSRIILHDSGKFILEKRPKLSAERRKELAQEEFEGSLTKAQEFYANFQFNFENNYFGLAAFNLQQVAENLLQMVQLVFICRDPHTHNLQYLRRKAIELVPEISVFFPQNTKEEIADLKYLSDAYVGGRYLSKTLFPVTESQLKHWEKQVQLLFEITQKACENKIEKGWTEEEELLEDEDF